MCGFVVLTDPNIFPLMGRALDSMEHRGLTSRVYYNEGSILLGHRRLPIINLSEDAEQPMQVGGVRVMLVGEILNYKDLYPDAESDTEALGRMWIDSGPIGFHQFDGFWSAIIQYGDRLFNCYTDHLGIKPVYYGLGMVASEIATFEAVFPKLTPDPIFFSNVLKWGYDPTGRTPWKEVMQMPPGCELNQDFEVTPYWDWDRIDADQPLEMLMTKAVENRMVSDRPVSLLLSGGLDSTIVFKILTETLGIKDLTVFHVENGEQDALEAALDGFPSQALPVTLPSLEDSVEALQMPVDIGSLQPQLGLARAVHDAGFYVTMSGDGADELFGGYRRAADYDSQHSDVFVELPYWHLPRLDRVMMRHTVELRTPYLAPKVVKYALELPWQLRQHKEALRDALRHLIPDYTYNLRKKALKSHDVLTGGLAYRKRLIQLWRTQHDT